MTTTTIDTRDLIEAACCLWEATLEIRSRADVDAAFEAQGTSVIRSEIMDLAERCHVAWEAAVAEGYDDPFDWEFVPAWLEKHVRFDETGAHYRAE